MKRLWGLSPEIWGIIKEAARHILKRPVVGVALAAQTSDGRWLLIRRGDTGDWALPGGTLEWGETLTRAAERELREEAGAELQGPLRLCGVYSSPERDRRFHSVTVLVHAEVGPPTARRWNAVEILEVGLFADADLPKELSHGMTDMLRDARSGQQVIE